MFFASILLIAALDLLFDTPRPIPGPFDWILSGLLFILGLAITLPSARLFHRVKTNIMTYNDPNELVTSGWFRHTRNPIYLGMVVVLAGISIGFGELLGSAVPLIFLMLMDRPFIPMEETAMQRVFSARYDEYRGKVRRWI